MSEQKHIPTDTRSTDAEREAVDKFVADSLKFQEAQRVAATDFAAKIRKEEARKHADALQLQAGIKTPDQVPPESQVEFLKLQAAKTEMGSDSHGRG